MIQDESMLFNTKWLTIIDSSHMYDENHCVFGIRKILRDDISVDSSVVLYKQGFPYGCRFCTLRDDDG